MLAALFAAMMCLQLVGCGDTKQSEPIITNDGEVFSCTKQELVDLLNAGAEQNDISTIDYDGKNGSNNIVKTALRLNLSPYGADEKPDEIRLSYYHLGGDDATLAFGYYVGAILGLLDPESADSISQEIFSFIESNPTDYEVNMLDGTHIHVSIAHYRNSYGVFFSPLAIETATSDE